jgi:hypothetical protein
MFGAKHFSLENSFQSGFRGNQKFAKNRQNKAKCLSNTAAKKKRNGRENLEKQQQTATNLGAWKQSGMELEIAIGFGSQQGCQRREKLADDFLKLKSKRRSSYSRQSETVLLNLPN